MQTARRGPLHGVRVLEFGHMVLGPSCGLVLADLGAEVVRVDSPGGGPTRRLKGFGMGSLSCYYHNKSNVVLDVKKPEPRAVVGQALR